MFPCTFKRRIFGELWELSTAQCSDSCHSLDVACQGQLAQIPLLLWSQEARENVLPATGDALAGQPVPGCHFSKVLCTPGRGSQKMQLVRLCMS